MVMLTGVLLAFAVLVEAGTAPPSAANNEDHVRCESGDGRMKRCQARLQEGDQVQILRQLSRSECIRNGSWGVVDGDVWVARGCRAEFVIIRAGDAPIEKKQVPTPQPSLITCESSGGQERCAVDTRGGVRLHKQLSGMACVHGKTWGYDPDAVWVALGCRAQFEVQPAPKTSLWKRMFGRDEPAAPVQAIVRCESRDGREQRCNTHATGVELVRQLSRTTCVINRNWGWDERGIWVKDGCRAEFQVR